MSQFTIQGQYYDGSSSKKIHQILSVDTVFSFCYDFGSSTDLMGKVISSIPVTHNIIHLLARNTLPEDVVCSSCKKEAIVICNLCGEYCCENCQPNHECQEDDMMSPIVNSPRMGVC